MSADVQESHNKSDEHLISFTRNSRSSPDVKIALDVGTIFDHMLGDGYSTIDPSVKIWTKEIAEELRSRIEDNPIVGSEFGQWDKLEQQLDGATDQAVLMAAELVFLREQPLRTATPATRRKHVEAVLSHLEDPIEIPPSMIGWLNRPPRSGGFVGGQGYNGLLYKHLTWASTFIREWCRLPLSNREAARRDPWKLQKIMIESGQDVPDIRNAFQYLARPDVFEAIASRQLKEKIRNSLGDRIGGISGKDAISIDRDLLAIRAAIMEDFNEEFHYWTDGVQELWDPSESSVKSSTASQHQPVEQRERHYWLYSPGNQAEKWGELSKAGLMAVAWDSMGDLSEFQSQESMRQKLIEIEPRSDRSNDARTLWEFQNEIAIGDVIFVKRGRKSIIGRGEVSSHAKYDPARSEYKHVRSVEWTHFGDWANLGNAALKTLTDITMKLGLVEYLEDLIVDDSEENSVVPVIEAKHYSREDFLSDVYMPEHKYDRLIRLVRRKKNVILNGPPGVGKTYLAKRLAWSIMGEKDSRRLRMVQFHQSYSYEDFMMGFRPNAEGGFTLVDGPFYRFCETARADDPERDYFFLIDEINRGNVSKILGELLMLIEADKRGQELQLIYNNENFSVPPNVHILGMMNTADRSLAVMDYALRRRFGFYAIEPGYSSDGFEAWRSELGNETFDSLVKVIVELNIAIREDPALGAGFTIGHSYLSRPADGITDDDWLFSVIEDEFVPLLEEYWFDEPILAAEWTAKLRAAIQ